MEMQFRNLDRAIESQPMPSQFQDTKALISCNDCSAKSSVKYHWLGLKCAVCDSYNTAQIQILSDPEHPTAAHPATVEPPPSGHDETVQTRPTSRGRGSRAARPSYFLADSTAQPRRPTSSASTTDNNMRFSPYHVPQRGGRSVSPMRSFGDTLNGIAGSFLNELEHLSSDDDEDEDEDEVGFWGGELPGDQVMVDEESDEESGEEAPSEDEDMDDASDNNDDEIDEMALFGHQ